MADEPEAISPEAPAELQDDPSAYAIRRVTQVVSVLHTLHTDPPEPPEATHPAKAAVSWQLSVWSGPPRKKAAQMLSMGDFGDPRRGPPTDPAKARR